MCACSVCFASLHSMSCKRLDWEFGSVILSSPRASGMWSSVWHGATGTCHRILFQTLDSCLQAYCAPVHKPHANVNAKQNLQVWHLHFSKLNISIKLGYWHSKLYVIIVSQAPWKPQGQQSWEGLRIWEGATPMWAPVLCPTLSRTFRNMVSQNYPRGNTCNKPGIGGSMNTMHMVHLLKLSASCSRMARKVRSCWWIFFLCCRLCMGKMVVSLNWSMQAWKSTHAVTASLGSSYITQMKLYQATHSLQRQAEKSRQLTSASKSLVQLPCLRKRHGWLLLLEGLHMSWRWRQACHRWQQSFWITYSITMHVPLMLVESCWEMDLVDTSSYGSSWASCSRMVQHTKLFGD